nr:capsid protein precursor [Dromedary astrovirus]
MANRQQKRGPRTTTNIVVRNGTAAPQARAPAPAASNRRRKNRARRPPHVNVRVLPSQNQSRRKIPRRQGIGSGGDFQKINSTLGTVGSNGSEQIECELTCLINPATMKEATGSNSFSPLGIYASTYALYRMTRCTLVLKPLVGDSAVSGTVTRVSWNPTSTPTQTSWSALGARKHVDATPGKVARFTLTSRDLVGPKGGWFKTNTKGDPMMCFAGTLEIHTLGKTMSTYQNAAFTGGLYLAELETHWQFKDYAQQPGMLNLVKGEDTQNARLETDSNGKLQLVVPNSTRMARAASGSTSEVIWLVTDTMINLGASVLFPPFNWLVRGGWWLIKRAAGAPVRSGETVFDVYSSISDARSDTPCISTQVNADPVQVGGLHFQQVTPGNIGIGGDQLVSRAYNLPDSQPGQCYVVSATMLKLGQSTANTDNTLVPSYSAYFTPAVTQNNTTGVGFLVGDVRVATYNIKNVTAVTDAGPVDQSRFVNTIPVKLFHPNGVLDVGRAVAGYYAHMDESPSLRVSTVLFYATSTQSYNFQQTWREIRVNYPVNSYQATVAVSAVTQPVVRIHIQQGNWYTAQFVTQGVVDDQYMVGDVVVASRATTGVVIGTTNFVPRAADSQSGLIALCASKLNIFTTSQIHVDHGTRTLAEQELDPAFGFDDALEDIHSEADHGVALDEDESDDLELEPGEHYSDPPISRLVVHPQVQTAYEHLREQFTEREARLAANQLKPSDEYTEFTSMYHDALADGLSPRDARAYALGL